MNRYLMTAVFVLGALALAGCPSAAPNTSDRTPGPTPVLMVTTTATRLDPSAAATVTAGPLLDVPGGKYVMLRGSKRESYCSDNCSCPPPYDDNWGALSRSERGRAMRNMIRAGAKGFFDWSESSSYSPCACTIQNEERSPIQELPFRGIGEFTIYRVDPDGTVAARVSNAMYVFKPGDTWSSTFLNSPAPRDCVGYLESEALFFRNDGLLDESQFSDLSAPTPTPMPGTPTRTAQ